MAVVRAQCLIWQDSPLPRDALVINPCFNNTGGIWTDSNWNAFGDALAASLKTYFLNRNQVQVKIFPVEGTPPLYPLANQTAGQGLFPAGQAPREIAICLSFYADQNRPRRRGRLYVPFVAITDSGPGLRPTIAQRTKVGELATLLSAAGGQDIDWSVYSKADGQARKVTNWWVDDEWDVVRSRGLRGTTRTSGTMSG
jgi:hypothetical protein